MDNERTERLLNELKDSSNVYNYISKYNEDFPNISFTEYISLIIQKKNLKKGQVVKKTGINRTYAYQIISGKKKGSRDKIITLAYGLTLTIEETQKLLKLAAFNPLDPKNKRDAIIIFAICNNYDLSKTNFLLFENKVEPIS